MGHERPIDDGRATSALSLMVLQKSANERAGPKNAQYQIPKARFLESRFRIQDLI
jgi:hypothetical protein